MTWGTPWLAEIARSQEFAGEYFVLAVCHDLSEVMHDQKVSKREMARRLGKDRRYVTRLLEGSEGFTLREIADAFHVLGYRVERLKLHPIE